ncbi:hypothetical protein HHI36_010975 [Cryptolaemus montrouzieri]
MNMTQICINETKCGYARFIEKRKDLGQLYPADFDREIFTVTVKKGCMDEDYCSTIQIDEKFTNASECIFCEEDLCDLKFPLLCVECDESEEKYCPLLTEPMISCSEGEVCYRLRSQESNYTQKRGCMDPSQCLKENLCEYCDTDICWTNPIPSPAERQAEQKENASSRRIAINRSNSVRGDYNYFAVFCGIYIISIIYFIK